MQSILAPQPEVARTGAHTQASAVKQPLAMPTRDIVEYAMSLAKAGFFGRSLDILDQALQEQPDDRHLIYERALILLDWGRMNEAHVGLRAAAAAGLSSFGLHVNLSQVCHARGLNDDAERHALRAIAADDGQAAGHLCLAVVLHATKRYAEAIRSYQHGYDLAPERVDCLWEIVSCLLDQEDAMQGEVVARRAISMHGNDHAKPWALLGAALALQRRWDEAMVAFERAEEIEAANGLSGETFVIHGFQLYWSNQIDAAIALYRRYLPTCTNPAAHAHCGLVLLTAGHLQQGWRLYEFRWTSDRLLPVRPRLGRPEWRGQELNGKKLLLWAEQGVGDFVQFVRLARLFKDKGAVVVVHVPERIKEFAKSFRDVDRVVSELSELAEGFDYHLSLMSASGALGLDLLSIPSFVPYLTVYPDRKRRWHERLKSSGSLRVGLVWAGNPSHEHDKFRSIELARLTPLFGVEGVRFFSLQKDPRPRDAGALPTSAVMVDLAGDLRDFSDTAAAIDELDLVIAVDTAVVHIAGALGKPVWIMLQTPPDFRWLTAGDDSPWYPTARLFRQEKLDEWDKVIADVQAALAEAAGAWRVNAGAAPLGPVVQSNRHLPASEQSAIVPLCGITDTRHGIVQYLRREETLARSLEFYGEWLEPQLEIVAFQLRAGSVVIEAGSGIGAHTLALARHVTPSGSVYAYEPDAVRARILLQNLQLNQVRDQVTLMVRHLVRSTAQKSIDETESVATADQPETCDAVDDLALARLDLLKINCASASDEILRGANDTIWRLRPMILTACDSEHVKTLCDRMQSFGYRCWQIVTPYFVPTNHSHRNEDIFTGQEALALVGVPEELDPPEILDNREEISEL